MLATINVADGVFNSNFNTRIVVVNQFTHAPATGNFPFNFSSEVPGKYIDFYKNYYNSNHSSQARDAGIMFTGDNYTHIFGEVTANGALCGNLDNVYAFVTYNPWVSVSATHEIGHLFGAEHATGSDCSPNISVMCPNTTNASLTFASTAQNQINSHLNAGDACLRNFSSIGMQGPTLLCVSSSGTYEALGGIQNQNNSWVWTSSSNISLGSTTGKIITATGLYTGNGWVEATQTAGCAITYRYNIVVGTPTISFKVNGQPFQNGYICRASTAYIEVVGNTQGNSYNWSLNAGSTGSLSGSGTLASFSNYNIACSGISVQASNACGTSSTGLTICTNNCGRSAFNAYPNPAKDFILIEFEHAESLWSTRNY
jgi:hypothetical protein